EKDRNLRYQHASDMRAELQRLKRDTDSGRSAILPAATESFEPEPVSSLPPKPSSGRQETALSPSSPVGARHAGSSEYQAAAPSRFVIPIAARNLLLAVGVAAALIAVGLYWRSAHAAKLTDKDTIVLADFTNTTGDA